MSGSSSDAHGRPKIGQTLALTRRERGLSLKEVEEATKIRAIYLRELEMENFDVLPDVYVQGSLKTYANFLHLDGEDLVRELKRRRAPVDSVEEEQAPPASEPQRRGAAPRGRRTTLQGAGITPGRPAPGEDREASMSLYGYLALVFAVFVTLALVAAVLVSTLAWNEESAVLGVREPVSAKAPHAKAPHAKAPHAKAPQPSSTGGGETGDARLPASEGAGTSKTEGGETDDAGSRQAPSPVGSGRGGGFASSAPAIRGAQLEELPAPAAGRRAPLLAREPLPALTGSGTTAPGAIPEPSGPGISPAPAAWNPSSPVPVYIAFAHGGEALAPGTTGEPGPVSGVSGGVRSDFEVQIVVGADDPVRINGRPVAAP